MPQLPLLPERRQLPDVPYNPPPFKIIQKRDVYGQAERTIGEAINAFSTIGKEEAQIESEKIEMEAGEKLNNLVLTIPGTLSSEEYRKQVTAGFDSVLQESVDKTENPFTKRILQRSIPRMILSRHDNFLRNYNDLIGRESRDQLMKFEDAFLSQLTDLDPTTGGLKVDIVRDLIKERILATKGLRVDEKEKRIEGIDHRISEYVILRQMRGNPLKGVVGDPEGAMLTINDPATKLTLQQRSSLQRQASNEMTRADAARERNARQLRNYFDAQIDSVLHEWRDMFTEDEIIGMVRNGMRANIATQADLKRVRDALTGVNETPNQLKNARQLYSEFLSQPGVPTFGRVQQYESRLKEMEASGMVNAEGYPLRMRQAWTNLKTSLSNRADAEGRRQLADMNAEANRYWTSIQRMSGTNASEFMRRRTLGQLAEEWANTTLTNGGTTEDRLNAVKAIHAREVKRMERIKTEAIERRDLKGAQSIDDVLKAGRQELGLEKR